MFHFPLLFSCYGIKNNSPILCQLFWPTSFLWQQHVFKVYNFFFYLRTSEKIHEKCGTIGVWIWIKIWNFPNSKLQETHFQAFYSHTSRLLWRIILSYIILIFLLDCFIVLYLRFYILEWSSSKVYGRYMWVGFTTSQV